MKFLLIKIQLFLKTAEFYNFSVPSEESDLAYLERVGGGGLVGVWAFFAPLMKNLLGQQVLSTFFSHEKSSVLISNIQPTVVMYSEPGWGKTTLMTIALKMVSKMSRLCSNQVAI